MDDNWLRWILGGVATMTLGWLRHLHVNQKEFVTRDVLDRHLDAMREDNREMHRENRDTLNRIHERVDSLWQRGR